MSLGLNCGTDNPEGFVYCFNCGSLSVRSIIKNGFNDLKKNPRLLIITLCFLLLNLFFVQTNESLRNSFLYTSSPYYYPTYYYLPLVESFTIFMIRFLIQCFAISWLLTSVKQNKIRRSETTLNLLKSLYSGIRFLPRITVANFLTLLIIYGAFFAILLLSFVLAFLFTYNSPAGIIASFILLFVLLPVAIVVCSGLTVLFTYVAQSVVFAKKGIFESLMFSWRFAKDHFLVTLGILLLIHIFSYGLNVILLTVLWWPFIESPPLIGLPIILVITQPFILTFQAISLSWVFDEFRYTIDEKESKTAQEYYQNH